MANILKTVNNVITGILPDPLSPENKGGFETRARQNLDGDGLPFQKQSINNVGVRKRNIMSWLIPEFGIVQMYVNPNRVEYKDNKLIKEERTKNGYSLQYWGEGLSELNISGTTASSGIEGINALYEIYRAEQLLFDTQGLVMDSQNTSDLADSLAAKATSFLSGGSGLLGAAGSLASGLLGLDGPSNNLVNKNIPSLAQYAFTIELYYNGMAYRGFFTTMNVTESADNFPFQYNITFKVTQKRGYRRNFLPFHRNASAPINDSTPYTFTGIRKE